MPVEVLGVVCRIKRPATTFAANTLDFIVANQVIFEAARNNLSLGEHGNTCRQEAFDPVNDQGVMCACEQDQVRIWRPGHQRVNMLTDKIIGSAALVLIVFNKRHPHWTGFLRYLYLRKELFYLHEVGSG